MSTAAQLQRIWPWLPVFRVVAETQHLPTAAGMLHVSASALSRTVKQLEDHLGEPLFVRRSRRPILSPKGRVLLTAVREAMDAAGEGLQGLIGEVAGEFRVGLLAPATNDCLVPCVMAALVQYPKVVPSLAGARVRDANARLVAGTLDLAFYYHPIQDPAVRTEELGNVTSSVYCGRGHPLFGRGRIGRGELLEHAFSVPDVDESGRSMDDWPPDLPRRIGMHVQALSTQVEIVLAGRFLGVLPDATAAAHVQRGTLARLGGGPVVPTVLYAAYTDRTAEHPFLRDVVARMKQRLADIARAVKRGRDLPSA